MKEKQKAVLEGENVDEALKAVTDRLRSDVDFATSMINQNEKLIEYVQKKKLGNFELISNVLSLDMYIEYLTYGKKWIKNAGVANEIALAMKKTMLAEYANDVGSIKKANTNIKAIPSKITESLTNEYICKMIVNTITEFGGNQILFIATVNKEWKEIINQGEKLEDKDTFYSYIIYLIVTYIIAVQCEDKGYDKLSPFGKKMHDVCTSFFGKIYNNVLKQKYGKLGEKAFECISKYIKAFKMVVNKVINGLKIKIY